MENKLNLQNIITGVAGTLLLGVAGWLLNTTMEIQKDTEIIKEKLEQVYADDCPYCVHAAHSSITEHPLLSPTIKKAHIHTDGGEVIFVNE